MPKAVGTKPASHPIKLPIRNPFPERKDIELLVCLAEVPEELFVFELFQL